MEEKRKTSRTLQAEAMREQLQSIVQNMAKEKPLDEIRIADIAKAANISVGNFYQYFASKEEALIYSYKVKDGVWQTLGFENITDPVERLQKILWTHLYSMIENSLCFDTQLYISQLKVYEDYFFTEDRYLHKIVQDTIQEAQENGEIKTKYTPLEIRTRLLNYSRGLVYNYCIEHKENHVEFFENAITCVEDMLSLYIVDTDKIDLHRWNA